MTRVRLLVLRWKMELHAILETIWENRWSGICFTAVFVGTAACFLYWVPAPGVCVAVMGVAAALMAARSNTTGAEKATWMLIISALLVIEVLAIRKDRDENEQLRLTARSQEASAFQAIADSITGGTSYPYFFAFSVPTDADGASLVALVMGDYALSDVSYELTVGRPPYKLSQSELSDLLAGRGKWIKLGNLHPHYGVVVGNILHPDKDGGFYNVNFSARNGETTEKLEIRRKPNSRSWETRVSIMRNDITKQILNFGDQPQFVWTQSLPK